MEARIRPLPDLDVLTISLPLPGYGVLPVNAFVIHSEEPVLVDTGPTLDAAEERAAGAFMEALGEAIDPADLRWIWLTHTDQDHVGALNEVLEAAPHARVVTTFLGLGKMGLWNPLPLDRVLLLNPGQTLDVGDRTLTAFKPPSYDAPETTGLFDHATGVLVSSDCFGAVLPSASADARDIAEEDLREGQRVWASIDSPWLEQIDVAAFRANVGRIRSLAPRGIVSSHLPPAFEMTERLLANLEALAGTPGFVGPDQEGMAALLADVTEGPPSPA